jgi:methylmalonyl-CoA mutase
MATNISNLLKEESYFDKVIDPLSGSYVIENLTELLIEKGWNYFLELDAFKSLNSKEKIEKIKQDMRAKATERIAKFKSNETKLIGMNLFNKENPSAQTWKSDLSYLGVPYLIYELNV